VVPGGKAEIISDDDVWIDCYGEVVIVTVERENPQRITVKLWRGSDNDMGFQQCVKASLALSFPSHSHCLCVCVHERALWDVLS